MSTGAELIAAERERQVTEEGYYATRDRGHEHQLTQAARSYAESAHATLVDDAWMVGMLKVCPPRVWPWAAEFWKPTGDPVRDLVKAGALIAAAIDALSNTETGSEA